MSKHDLLWPIAGLIIGTINCILGNIYLGAAVCTLSGITLGAMLHDEYNP